MGIKIIDVFSTSRLPKYSYVTRKYKNGQTYDDYLHQSLQENDKIISISGPTKCGKTTLTKRVIEPKALVRVHGADVDSPDKLWEIVLAKLNALITAKKTDTSEDENEAGVEGSWGPFGWLIPASVKAHYKWKGKKSDSVQYDAKQSDHHNAIRLMLSRSCVLVIDDFHYIDPEVQKAVCRQLKGDLESESGHPPIVVCSIPSKADSTTRALSELQGRVKSIEFKPWDDADLLEIAVNGFGTLKYPLSNPDLLTAVLVPEALGSPHVMQDCCKYLCEQKGVRESRWRKTPVTFTEEELKLSLREVAASLHYERVYKLLEEGVSTKGQPRKIHLVGDGVEMQEADVYQILLKAIEQNPPRLRIRRNELDDRIGAVVKGDLPARSSVGSVLGKLDRLVLDSNPKNMVLEWDEGAGELIIRDPLFLLYLRHGLKQ